MARVIAVFDGGQEVVADLLESGHPDIRFFLAMELGGKPLVEIIVLDETGQVLERVPSPTNNVNDI